MMLEITSFSNPRYKQLKSLAKSRNRKKEGLFIAEGRPELDVAIRTGIVPVLAIFCEAYISYNELISLVGDKVEVLQLSKALFDDLVYQQVPGNFIIQFKSWECGIEALSNSGDVVVLESLEKPGNLGAILRTCDAAGVKDVIVCESDIDLFNPNVIRNSRGAAFTVNVVFCSNDEALGYLKSRNLPVYAAALSDAAVDYSDVKDDGPKALIFGAESKGLSEFWMNKSDKQIIIPMLGTVDSLNLSVSAAVILFGLRNKSSE
ncbi:MAG: TrmH family RNA methyltransferase [Flavobacteriales bacterium]